MQFADVAVTSGFVPKFNTMVDLMAYVDTPIKADANKETNIGRSKGAKEFRARRKAEKRSRRSKNQNRGR